METEQKQKKILFAGLTILVLTGIFLYSTSLLERNTPVIQTTEPQSLVPTEVEPEVEAAVELPRVSTLDWKKVQFDACGGEAKYSKMPWWDKFSAQVKKFAYYSEGQLLYSVKRALLNAQSRSSVEDFCRDNRGDQMYVQICEQDRKKRLSVDDFKDYGEGCLSKDGSAFIAIFPGVYMGEGNHLFRYDINEDILEEAKKIFDIAYYSDYGWNAPPAVFGKRVNNIVRMSGGVGDAGCQATTEFDYDYVANTVEMTKRCNSCNGEKFICESL